MNIEELNKILDNHGHWIRQDCENWETMRADLHGAYLRGTDLSDADLSDADLSDADLSDADLWRADLRGAYLSGANLCGADMRGANLCGADMRGADLSGADLSGAYMGEVDLTDASLRRADLRGANLCGANLCGADMRGANLCDAFLYGAVISHDQKLNAIVPLACPEEGSFVGWKKLANDCIAKLLILPDAYRSSATGRKCRCSKATVLDIEDLQTGRHLKAGFSRHDNNFCYVVGETVSVGNFDMNRFNECAPGIHFFITRAEAVNYYL